MSTAQPQRPWRIIIVDDHPVMLKGTEQLFEGQVDLVVVGTATTGREALQQLDNNAPDLLILDIRLPDMSGVAVAQTVRATRPEVRILVLTGYDSPAYARALAQIGVHGLLSKTTPGPEIVCAARRICTGETLPIAVLTPLELSGEALTEREQTVLALLVAGLRNREIAEQLHISLKTVEFHVSQLLEKLGARSRTEAMSKAISLGLVTPGETHQGAIESV